MRRERLKAISIGARSNLKFSEKSAPHDFSTAEAAGNSNFLQASIAFFQPPPRRLQSQAFHKFGWRISKLSREYAGKIARPHSGPAGKGFNAEVLPQVLGHPHLELP